MLLAYNNQYSLNDLINDKSSEQVSDDQQTLFVPKTGKSKS